MRKLYSARSIKERRWLLARVYSKGNGESDREIRPPVAWKAKKEHSKESNSAKPGRGGEIEIPSCP